MTTTNQGAEPRIRDELRLTEEQIAEGTHGEAGLKRVYKAAELAEDNGFKHGWEAKAAQMDGEAEAAQELAKLARQMAPNPLALGDDDPSIDKDGPAYLAGVAAGLAQAALGEVPDPLVPCRACHGSGKMPQWGSQCKTCFGATKVRASSLVTE